LSLASPPSGAVANVAFEAGAVAVHAVRSSALFSVVCRGVLFSFAETHPTQTFFSFV